MKFGGTSVGSVESILSVKKIVEGQAEPVIVVVSALGGITDKIIKTSLMAVEGDAFYQQSFEEIKEVFEKANSSSFLQGKNEYGWVASFDWLIEIDNFVKVKEDCFGSSQKIKEPVPEVSKAQNGRNPDFLRLLESESKGKHAGNDS